MATRNQYQRIVPFIIFALALVLFYLLLRPSITILLSSILLAFLTFPLSQRVKKVIPNTTVSLILSLFIVALLISIPFLFLTFEVTQQGYIFYHSLSNNVAKGAILGFGCASADSKVCALVNQAERFSVERLSAYDIDKQLQKFVPIVEERLTLFFLSIPIIIAEIFLTFFITYFILKEWKTILQQVADILPMRTKTIRKLTKEFGDITYTVVYASLFVALVQGIIGTIGFYVFGVPFPIILGILTAFCALLPSIGTAIIWAPASLYLILRGYFSHDYWTLAKGIGLAIYGLVIVSSIDNLLLAKIVQARAKVSQITVIVGVIGGATMFGIVGIFIGPIMLPLLITYFETFKERFV